MYQIVRFHIVKETAINHILTATLEFQILIGKRIARKFSPCLLHETRLELQREPLATVVNVVAVFKRQRRGRFRAAQHVAFTHELTVVFKTVSVAELGAVLLVYRVFHGVSSVIEDSGDMTRTVMLNTSPVPSLLFQKSSGAKDFSLHPLFPIPVWGEYTENSAPLPSEPRR